MSCFIVPNSFNSHETIDRLQLTKLFQLPTYDAAETSLNEEPIGGCSRVPVVPLLILLLNETENVFWGRQRTCVPIVIVEQDSTDHVSCRGQHE